jgi:cytochrome c553
MFRSLIILALICAGGAGLAQDTSAEITAESCAVCHNDSATAIPKIGDRSFKELTDTLTGFRQAGSTVTIMHNFVAGLTAQEIEDLARFLSRKEEN